MAKPSPFSRLQLAAALLEYDNDPDDPTKPVVDAKQSALFIPFRNSKLRPSQSGPRRSSDFLGVALPSDGGQDTLGPMDSDRRSNTRMSRASTNALAIHNPFRGSVASANITTEGGQDEGEMELDLSSWGLDNLMAKDAKDVKGKGKAKSIMTPMSEKPPMSSVAARFPKQELNVERKPTFRHRSRSVGDYDGIVAEASSGLYDDDNINDEDRRKSYASPLDLVGVQPVKLRSNSFSGEQTLKQPSVPFPARSPAPTAILPLPDDPEDLDARPALHARAKSNASWNSDFILRDQEARGVRGRSNSNATMNTMDTRALVADENNPFTIRAPSVMSRFDPKGAAHQRTYSNATMNTRQMMDYDDDDVDSVSTEAPGGRKRYSTALELLRPKVLIMPSPLQDLPKPKPRDLTPGEKMGFALEQDQSRPLPPGARSARSRNSAHLLDAFPTPSPPNPGNAFTPNPRNNLTGSQLMFRDALAGADGNRDLAYSAGDANIPRAVQDGEQAQFYVEDLSTEVLPTPGEEDPAFHATRRPPGKLYGRSLIDNLDERKQAMKSRQRVFRGDDRPKMMSRSTTGNLQRSSTLIDPATLGAGPPSQTRGQSVGQQSSAGGLNRNASKRKTLLDFEGEKLPETNKAQGPGAVFGVDTLWEREMLKLKQMEAAERAEAEERERQEGLFEAREENTRKSTLMPTSTSLTPDAAQNPEDDSVEGRVSTEPPRLPSIRRAAKRRPPIVGDEDEEESEEEEGVVKKPVDTSGWNAGSSSEDEGPRKTTGVGLRNKGKKKQNAKPELPQFGFGGAAAGAGEESDEDVPLAATIGKAKLRSMAADDDSDEDKPLAQVAPKISRQTLLANPSFGGSSKQDDSDDEEPLGIRASRMPKSVYGSMSALNLNFDTKPLGNDDEDEDDKPLGLHPEQQRRTMMFNQQQGVQQQQQQFMMAQQQAQQQQMMMQSMYMNPMMGSGFFNPMAPMMTGGPMMPPQQVPSPPPMQAPAKVGQIDRWRHDVAVEGE